jgi:hypothetical protein
MYWVYRFLASVFDVGNGRILVRSPEVVEPKVEEHVRICMFVQRSTLPYRCALKRELERSIGEMLLELCNSLRRVAMSPFMQQR